MEEDEVPLAAAVELEADAMRRMERTDGCLLRRGNNDKSNFPGGGVQSSDEEKD